MDDRFLHELRREPPPEFARELRERLRERPEPSVTSKSALRPVLAAAAAVVVVAALFTLPSVRASAAAFLDLFRVRTFAAVPFDESRFDKIKGLQSEDGLVVFDKHEIVRDPGPPQYYPTLDAAGVAASLAVRRPTYLPNGLLADSVFVLGEGEAKLAISEAKLRSLLDALDLREVSVPSGIDGQWVDVRKPPMVLQRFRGGGRWNAEFVQAMSPEVQVPAGLDVERLAEVGLRILGLDAGEARRIATTTDWRSTFMIPVPMNASTFRQVTIHGQQGLLITTAAGTAKSERRREGTVALWTENGRVYALTSNLGSPDVMQMAESVQ